MLHHVRGGLVRHARHRVIATLCNNNTTPTSSDIAAHVNTQLWRRLLSTTTTTTTTTATSTTKRRTASPSSCRRGQHAALSTTTTTTSDDSSSPTPTTSTRHRQVGYTHDGYQVNTSTTGNFHDDPPVIYERVYGPDKQLSPKSRKPLPFKVITRNTTGPYEAKGHILPFYPKRKHARKRSTGLLNALASEEALRMVRDGRAAFAQQLGRPQPGQILRIGYVGNIDDEEMKWFAGVVMVTRNKLLGASVILRNVVQGVAVERCFPLFSPLVKEVKIIGQRRVTRNKMYFLREKPLRQSMFGNALENPNYEKKTTTSSTKSKK